MVATSTSFTTTTGKRYNIRLTVGLINRILKLTGQDFLDPFTDPRNPDDESDAAPGPLWNFTRNLRLRGMVLWICCEEECLQEGITPEDFANQLGPENLRAAHGAFVGALRDFFHHQERLDLVAGIDVILEAIARAIDEARKTIKSEGMRALMDQEVGKVKTTAEDILATGKRAMRPRQ